MPEDLGPVPLRRAHGAVWRCETADAAADAPAPNAPAPDAPRVTLEVPKFGPFGTRLLQAVRLSPTVRLRLDPIASTAWLALDGRRLADVLAQLQARFPSEEGLEDRLGHFVSMLLDRGLAERAGPALREGDASAHGAGMA